MSWRLKVNFSVCLLSLSSPNALAQVPPGYEVIENHGLNLHNISKQRGGGPFSATVQECARLCSRHAECRGFEYFKRQGRCVLNDANARTAPGAVVKNRTADFYQPARTATPAPSAPRPPDWRVSPAYCASYAKTAVEQHNYNLQHKCGYTGRRWTGDYAGHRRWCLSVAPSKSKWETSQRLAALKECQKRGTAGGTSPGAGGHAGGGSAGGGGSAAPISDSGTGGRCINGYIGVAHTGVNAHNDAVLRGHTFETCRGQCNARLNCLSFEYSSKSKVCQLGSVNRNFDRIQVYSHPNHPWVYYEKCGANGQAPQIWQTAIGRKCLADWIRDTETKLNRFKGPPGYNARKPFRVNKYGLIIGSGPGDRGSFAPPDDWNHPSVRGDRFAWLWKNWRSEAAGWHFGQRTKVPLIGFKYFIRRCIKR